MSEQAPGGLNQTDFKTVALESGQWLWGMVQGAFNQKATLSQIVVDAVIGMIPLVGDVTAVRDITAVTVRMVDEEEAGNNVWEWVLLVVLVLALIPVVGGVIKGVGRLLIKAARESGHMANAAAKTAHMAEAAKEIIAFLNRLGHGHAEKWLLKLKFAQYQAQVLQHFKSLMDTMAGAFTAIENKLGRVLSGALRQRVVGLKNGVLKLKTKGEEMIPQAIKELDAKLLEIQTFIRSGGETTSRATTHTAAAGDKAAIHMTDEARLFEEFGAKRSADGGLLQNVAMKGDDAPDFSHLYKHEPGYPDLTKRVEEGHLTLIEAYAGRIVNRPLNEGEEIYRVFGPPGVTHGVPVRDTSAAGAFWGVGKPPPKAESWRRTAAVKDEWNRDGFMVVGTVPKNANVKSCVGLISEQVGEKIQGQYLQGGGMQAFIDWGKTPRVDAVTKKTLQQTGEEVIATGKAAKYTDPVTGMVFDVKPTGWEDANGIHGYVSGGRPGSVSVAPLASTEVASKTQTASPSRGTTRTAATQAPRGAARTQTSNNQPNK